MQAFSLCLLVLLAASLTAAQTQERRNCPPMWFGSGNKCLRFFKQTMTWQDATNFCTRFSSCATGSASTLLKIGSAEDDMLLENFLGTKGNPSPPSTWIGLGDRAAQGMAAVFTWPDGTTTQTTGYSNFDGLQSPQSPINPNGRCALKSSITNRWNLVSCTEMNTFVCEIDRNLPLPGGPGTGNPAGPARPI